MFQQQANRDNSNFVGGSIINACLRVEEAYDGLRRRGRLDIQGNQLLVDET